MGNGNLKRYSFLTQIVATGGGTLFMGKDLSLNRSVLLYRPEDSHSTSTYGHAEIIRAAKITEAHFLHMLDIGHDEQGFFVVLEHRPGQLLQEQLDQDSHSVWDGIRMIHTLGQAILEAQSEQIRDFSLSPDNIWYSANDTLMIIDYWTQEVQGLTPSKSLIHLLFQLLTPKNVLPSDFGDLENHLRNAMRSLPSPCVDHFLHLCHQIFFHDYNLASFIVDLGFLLEKYGKNDNVNGLEIVSTTASFPEEKSRKKMKKRFIFFPIGVFFVLCVTVALLVGKWSVPKTNNASSTAVPVKKEAPQTNNQTAAPSIPKDKPVSTSTDMVTVPDLHGLNQQEAEKQALAAGIHYQYFIESSKEPAGTVFKQDLLPGKQVPTSSKLTFWISKGN